MGTVPWRRDSSRGGAADGAKRSASDREIPGDWAIVESAGISEGVELQGGCGDGAAGEEAVRGVVEGIGGVGRRVSGVGP